jgi:hypothetical protein
MISLQKNLSPGDLVHVPAGTKLVQTNDQGDIVQDWVRTESPNALLVTKFDQQYCSVVYQGRRWKALTADCYDQGETL